MKASGIHQHQARCSVATGIVRICSDDAPMKKAMLQGQVITEPELIFTSPSGPDYSNNTVTFKRVVESG